METKEALVFLEKKVLFLASRSTNLQSSLSRNCLKMKKMPYSVPKSGSALLAPKISGSLRAKWVNIGHGRFSRVAMLTLKNQEVLDISTTSIKLPTRGGLTLRIKIWKGSIRLSINQSRHQES